jgi:hypothetical protein
MNSEEQDALIGKLVRERRDQMGTAVVLRKRISDLSCYASDLSTMLRAIDDDGLSRNQRSDLVRATVERIEKLGGLQGLQKTIEDYRQSQAEISRMSAELARCGIE